MIRLIFRTEIIFLIGVMQLELLQETKKWNLKMFRVSYFPRFFLMRTNYDLHYEGPNQKFSRT